jgi:rubrerythrin
MDILKALDIIEKLELKLSELYSHLSKLFSDNKEVSGIFFKLSIEEKGHADLIKFQRRLILKSKDLKKDIELDMVEINNIMQKADSILKSQYQITIKDALKSAIELENDSGEYHYRNFIKYGNSDLSLLLENLSKYDNEHIEQLKELLNKFTS